MAKEKKLKPADVRRYAILDDKNAQAELAMMYLEGKGVKKDIDKAIFWFTKAAEQGQNEAMFYLGSIYMNDKYQKKNIELAKFYLNESAKRGNAYAMTLAQMLR